MAEKTLYDRYRSEKGTLFEDYPDIPSYVTNNMGSGFREYQMYAVSYFMKSQIDTNENHLLFRMATGSGKTNILGATILYLFKSKGYQNFLFFVNSDAIVKKTYENLLNINASKYLFNKDGIIIDGEKVEVKQVNVFPEYPEKNTIFIKLTTVQKLHSDLNNPVENEPTFEFFENNKVVLLADEAHHLNAYTKGKNKAKLTKDELESKDWETTILAVLNSNPENKLLEFTATMDMENPDIYQKYKDKLIFNYDLTRFMEDKYSKNVVLLRANQDDMQKMLNAVLLSQYKKYIANENEIYLKPIILFKSNKIAISTKAHDNLLSMISNLSVSKLKSHLEEGLVIYNDENLIFNKVFNYFSKMDLVRVIEELQADFDGRNILNANKKEFLSVENSILLNTLEDMNNPVRAIFAVAKLNEGWDVLNLFDIVRISEEATGSINATDSEAQLIGRGARYYPFAYKGRTSFRRRFDEAPTDLKILEQLHYHTINDSKYVKNLYSSLKAAGVTTSEERLEYFEAMVKDSFKDSNLYKKGFIYTNNDTGVNEVNYKSFEDYGINSEYTPALSADMEQNLRDFLKKAPNKEEDNSSDLQQIYIPHNIWRKALQRNPFYHFGNLRKYINNIDSLNDFIKSENYLGQVKINVKKSYIISPVFQLLLAEKFLEYIKPYLKNNYLKPKGLTDFVPLKVNEIVADYNLNVVTKVSIKPSQKIITQPMRPKWFVYNNSVGNSLEQEFVNTIGRLIPLMKEKFSEIYLIRNEKKLKLIEFGGTRGFMPDYILCLEDEETFYQVFCEPKGGINLLEKDLWKEKFLEQITNLAKVKSTNEKQIKIIGTKFFSLDRIKRKEFEDDLCRKLGLLHDEDDESIMFEDYIN